MSNIKNDTTKAKQQSKQQSCYIGSLLRSRCSSAQTPPKLPAVAFGMVLVDDGDVDDDDKGKNKGREERRSHI